MIAKLGSPLSPATSLTAQLRNRLPTQLRRSLFVYAACGLLVFLFSHFQLFQSPVVRPPIPFASSPQPASGAKVRPDFRPDFPPKIWQVWKVNPLDFEARDHDLAKTWTGMNPDLRYEVLTDANEMRYVEYHYGPNGFDRPDIVNFFRDVNATIIKSDLLRYLIMYAEGGVYADIDVEAIRPVAKFIPERYDAKDFDLVVGVEIDEPGYKDHPILGPKSRSFCQWTFMSKPRLPVMMQLIEQIMSWLTKVAERQGVSIGEVDLDFDEIISGTGPSAFTNAIIANMNTPNGHPSADVGSGAGSGPPSTRPPITWDMFHDMLESKVVRRVLVLTVEAFAAGQGHSNSGTHESRAALVRHHYHVSDWPSRHSRMKHPAFGEVELCNWEAECVRKWDENVARFPSLDEAEKKRLIVERERLFDERMAEEKRKKEEEDQKRRQEEEAKTRKADEQKEAAWRKKWEEELATRRKEEEAKTRQADEQKEAAWRKKWEEEQATRRKKEDDERNVKRPDAPDQSKP